MVATILKLSFKLRALLLVNLNSISVLNVVVYRERRGSIGALLSFLTFGICSARVLHLFILKLDLLRRNHWLILLLFFSRSLSTTFT